MRNKYHVTQNVIPPTTAYPFGRINDNDGTGNGTPVVEAIYGDIHEFFTALLTLAGIEPNDQPDNFTNGHQSIQALYEFASKHSVIKNCEFAIDTLVVNERINDMKIGEFFIQRYHSYNDQDYNSTTGVTKIKFDSDPDTYPLFFPESWLYEANLLIIEKTSTGYTCSTLAEGRVLNGIRTFISELQTRPVDAVIEIGNRTISSNIDSIVFTTTADVLANILSWEIVWENYLVENALTLTDFQSNKTINMADNQEIMLGKFNDNPTQAFVRFVNFNGKALNKAKLLIKYKPKQTVNPMS